jgi:hypothetical protein
VLLLRGGLKSGWLNVYMVKGAREVVMPLEIIPRCRLQNTNCQLMFIDLAFAITK